jgi:hypothetical protein
MSDEPTRILQQQILDRLGSVETRMASLDERVEKRLAETRPIWERVLSELEAMRQDMDSMRRDMDNGFRTLAKKTEVLNKQVFEVRTDQGLLEERIEKLEPKT